MPGSKRFVSVTRDKQKRISKDCSTTSPSSALSLPTLCTCASGIHSMSTSASMRSTGFVSPDGRSQFLERSIGLDQARSHINRTGKQKVSRVRISTVESDTTASANIYQFVVERCNSHTDISPPHWWKPGQKYISQTFNRLRNDPRNTAAMKWAMLGKLHGRRGVYYEHVEHSLTISSCLEDRYYKI
jgi:hypothetical protein